MMAINTFLHSVSVTDAARRKKRATQQLGEWLGMEVAGCCVLQ